jgi:hypothetical protein
MTRARSRVPHHLPVHPRPQRTTGEPLTGHRDEINPPIIPAADDLTTLTTPTVFPVSPHTPNDG